MCHTRIHRLLPQCEVGLPKLLNAGPVLMTRMSQVFMEFHKALFLLRSQVTK